MTSLYSNNDTGNNTLIKVAYVGTQLKYALEDKLLSNFNTSYNSSYNELEDYLNNQSLLSLADIILMEVDEAGECFKCIEKLKRNVILQGLIIVLLSPTENKDWKVRALKLKVHDYYTFPFPMADVHERLNFLVKFKLIKPRLSELSKQVDVVYHLPWSKRLFDIVASGAALLFLSPFFLIIAIIIRLESKGPVIYKSSRVGKGYKIFDFYKFRSMRTDADKMLNELALLNQYAASGGNGSEKSAFVKFKDDPRVTKFGHFLRKLSLDELPQLFNVLKGDMSLVGNRPLPLYEAELLTSNEWSMRFLGPAGLTGLWQISKRGKEDMSERERKKLDNFYASNHSFLLDLKILLGTFPALLQKEKV